MSLAIKTKCLSMEYPLDKGIVKTIFHPFKKEKLTALSDVNVEVKKGEIFGLIGPNGAGKTTLIKILSTLLLPTNGTAVVGGYDLIKNPEKVRDAISLVNSEDRSFYWRLTGEQNLRFFASLHNICGKNAEERIMEVLSLVGLEENAKKRYDSFSTGMRQRLLFARGLLNNPSILFMDEPTRGMDIKIAKKIKDMIVSVKNKQKKTIFLTTHNMAEIEDLCDRVAILSKGKIVVVDSLDGLRKKTKERRLDKIFFKLVE